jgi:RNA polymerase sigma factor (sigma-70 family)
MMDGQQLLAQYAESGSETAFRELVTRYVDLVYSAAVRLVNGDTHLAEDVTQTVFADLARRAGALSREVMLGGWLHRHTCFVAGKTMRSERRRQTRERQAVEMNANEDHSAANLARLAPALDDAINQLGSEDRAAILLRFFDQRDFRSVGQALGSNEEAARKRVDRALARLEGLLKRRGVALSATALGATLATQAVTAAPAGLAISISGAALASAATGGGTALTCLKIMSMTKLQIGIVSAVVVAGISIPWVMHQRAQTKLHEANETLRQQAEANSRLAAENEELSKRLTQVNPPAPSSNHNPSLEVLKLRGEVGRLRRETAEVAASKTNGPSILSDIAANPEMMKMIRAQNKAALQMAYKDFAKKANLTAEQTEKLSDLLADNAVGCIEPIMEILRDGKTREEVNGLFDARDAAFLEKVQALLGPEGLAQYQDFTRDLVNHATAEQFKSKMTGETAAKEEKSKQLYRMMQEETQAALAAAGLSPDFQTAPMLNFRNIASEEEAERSLKLLDGIYERVAARAGSFLTADELKQFAEFRTAAISQNRMALAVNRRLMAPGPH